MTPAEFFQSVAQGDRAERPTVDRRHRRQQRSIRVELGTGREPPTLLLTGHDNLEHLAARPLRWWIFLAARFLASSLDRQLAEGRWPESRLLLAARAHVLISPVMRRELVDSWAHLLEQARRPPVMRDPRAPLNRHGITECEYAIQEMVEALLTPLPIPARGIAMASRLLRDGAGPIYNRHRFTDLGAALRETIIQLDASISLSIPP